MGKGNSILECQFSLKIARKKLNLLEQKDMFRSMSAFTPNS